MTTQILNAAPMSINLGIQDLSPVTPTPTPVERPTHLPLVLGWGKKGPTDKAYLVDSAARAYTFHADSFDPLQKWATHVTPYSNAFATAGNLQMYKRMQPPDAPPPATIRLYADLLATDVQDYQRNPDGSYKRDGEGQLVPTAGKIPGHMLKWVVGQVATDEATGGIFAQGTERAGDQVDGEVQSRRIPIMDIEMSSFGEWANNEGIRLWAPTINSELPVDSRLIDDQKVYPFYIAAVARLDSMSSAKVRPTLSGAQAIPFTFKKGVIDKNTTQPITLDKKRFVDAFQSINDPGVLPVFGPFGKIHVYDANVKALVEALYEAEYPHADTFSDFTGEDDEAYRFNFISGVTSGGVPYHSFQIVTGSNNSVKLSETNNVFALGGGDGTMDDAMLNTLVKEELLRYVDPNDPVQDAATHPISIWWDSGFSLDVKYAGASLISLRKDIMAVPVTHVAGGPVLTDDQERSVATAILTHYQQYAESSYFGTPAARGMIVGSSGFALGTSYDERLPASYELAMKSALFMGAGNGLWKASEAFDKGANAQVQYMRDLALPFRPALARNKDWDVGLVWPQSYNMTRSHFPQLQTIYPDDTSIINNFFNVMAAIECQKIGEEVHKDFSGDSEYTEDQLIERVNEAIIKKAEGKFAGRYEVRPETTFTVDDKTRKYSWTTIIKLYGSTMKTVQTLIVQTLNKDQLAQAA